MSLLNVAAKDARGIIESPRNASRDIKLIEPNGTEHSLTVGTRSISQSIDPDTGELVSGQFISITPSLLTLAERNISMPRNIQDHSENPWLVVMTNHITSLETTYKVIHSAPDFTLGLIVCDLGNYE